MMRQRQYPNSFPTGTSRRWHHHTVVARYLGLAAALLVIWLVARHQSGWRLADLVRSSSAGGNVHLALTRVDLTPSGVSSHPAAASAARTLLALINRDRRLAGLSPLHLESRLNDAAVAHSEDMAVHSFLSHTGLRGDSPYVRMARAGINTPYEGENLGFDQGGSMAAMLRRIDRAMMRSPEHRTNLLRSHYAHIGIGIVVSGTQVFVTEDFSG